MTDEDDGPRDWPHMPTLDAALTYGLVGGGGPDAALVCVMLTKPSLADLARAREAILDSHQKGMDGAKELLAEEAEQFTDREAKWWKDNHDSHAFERRRVALDVLARAEKVLRHLEHRPPA